MLIFSLLIATALGARCNIQMVVATIAQSDLSSSHEELLDSAESILSPLYGSLSHNIANSFIESACWASDIQDFGLDAFDDWHSINKPYNYDGFLDIVGSPINVVWAIDQCMKVLERNDLSEAILEGSMALRFLMHFLADVHQPLEVTNLWSEAFPTGDNRGKLFTLSNGSTNLHELWDSGLGLMSQELVRPLSDDDKKTVLQWASWSSGNYTRNDLADMLTLTTPEEWADSTFEVAVESVYNGIKVNDLPSQEYLDKGWKALMKQMALAGYRLSDLIQTLLAGKVVPS